MRAVGGALALVFVVVSGVVASAGQAKPPSGVMSAVEVEAILKARVGDHPGLGIVVGMIDPTGKRTVVSVGSAGEGTARPLDGDTVFEIGSATKVFTSALLADMVRRGEVGLDDAVAKLLPSSVRLPTKDGRDITLVSLATHTSGLPRMPGNLAPKDAGNPYADYTVEQMYQFLGTYQLGRPIGETYEYSNLGAGLLGHALATRLGKPYEAAVAERILRPLGMKDTAIALSAGMKPRRSIGHAASGDVTPDWDLPTLAGAGALRSTVNDMLTFLAANLGSGPADVCADLSATHVPRHDTGKVPGQIGLAWHIRSGQGVDVVWHNGGTGGFHSFIGFDKKRRVAVAVLHNSAASIDDIGFHLLDAQFPLAAAKPPAKPRVAIRVAPPILETYVGEYALAPTFVMSITREGDQLFLQATGQPRFPIFAETETRFFLKVVDAQITFEKDASGTVVELVLHQNGIDQRAKRKEE
jgi:D-alanyl-D-alanine-carboxypeptidase/D-alanyl-D-alanine-endopeptidase